MRSVVLAVLVACSGKPAGRLELVEAPTATAPAEAIAAERAKAVQDGKQLLVYVGATWCEPCQRFHEAAQNGELDTTFGQLRLMMFDNDRDGDRLRYAGYIYEMIPMFAVPRADGMASGQQIEGGINSDAAVDEIRPRLQQLVGQR